jgi:hypothetical protein
MGIIDYSALAVVFAMMAVSCRFYFMIYRRMKLGMDDWFALMTTAILFLSNVTTVSGMIIIGLGRDISELNLNRAYDFVRLLLGFNILYYLPVALGKLCFLFFYRRIFRTIGVKRVLHGTALFTALYGLGFIFSTIFQCKPMSFQWTHLDGSHGGWCPNPRIIPVADAIVSIVLDVVIMAIPLWQIRILQLEWKKTMQLGAMFCIGML